MDRIAGASLVAALTMLSTPSAAGERDGIFGPVLRDGFHAQVGFGWAGGGTSNGLLHNMELGHTFADSGWTLAYQHTFVMSAESMQPRGGSDLMGGHFFMAKLPLGYPDLIVLGSDALLDAAGGVRAAGKLGPAGPDLPPGSAVELFSIPEPGHPASLECECGIQDVL